MYSLNKSLVCFLLLTIIGSVLTMTIVVKAYDNAYNDYSVLIQPLPVGKSRIIRVSAPTKDGFVANPLVVKGEARGGWYFEGTFPVRLYDANNNQIITAPAKAKGEWTTNDFVPFEVTLKFAIPTTQTGMLVLEKDNPTDDTGHNSSISIPVRFSQ